MNETEHSNTIEALLFALGKPLSRKEFAQMLKLSSEEVDHALEVLSHRPGGVVLVDDGVSVELRTAPSVADTVEAIRKDEYEREIGRAGLETLAAILYRGPLSRSEIDFIRGVNSSHIIRTLMMRGLIRKVSQQGTRSASFEPTTQLLSHLGITHISDLPEYATVREELTALERAYQNQETSAL